VRGLLSDIINTGARAAKNSFIFGIIFTGFLWLASRKNIAIKTIGRGLLVSSIIGGITIMALSLRPGNAVYEIMKNRFGESTIHCRIIVWQIAWRGFLEHPLFGWGPENFELPFARYYNPRLGTAECGEVWFDRVHNIVLDTLVNSGIFGLLNYLLIFVVAVYLLWKLYFVGKVGFAQAGIFTALFASYFLQNLTVFDMITSYLMWVLCLGFIAFLYCEKQTDKTGEDSLPKPLKFWQVISASIFFAFYFNLFVLKPFFVDRDIITAAKMPYDSVDRLELSRDVLNSSRIGRYQARIFFAKQLLAAMQDKNIVAKLDIQIIEKEFSLLGGELEKSRWQSPLDFRSRLWLGQLYNMWGFIDRSKFALAGQVLLEAIKLAPQNQEGYVALAQNYILQGSVKEESVDLFQRAYDLYPGNALLKEMLDAVIKIRSQGKNF
jgi:hypothetical protein